MLTIRPSGGVRGAQRLRASRGLGVLRMLGVAAGWWAARARCACLQSGCGGSRIPRELSGRGFGVCGLTRRVGSRR